LENILRPVGYAVSTTTRGVEAMELVAKESYAAAFVDAKLPDIDGLELAALIRQRSPRTTVVLISAYFHPQNEAIIEGLQKGLFIGFVAKPFDVEQVRLIACQAVETAKEGGYTHDPHSAGR